MNSETRLLEIDHCDRCYHSIFIFIGRYCRKLKRRVSIDQFSEVCPLDKPKEAN